MSAAAGNRTYALLSAEDFRLVTAGHADRVHDLVIRCGCPPAGAVEVVQSTALDLLDAVVSAPETVTDLAGWWFASAAEVGRRAALQAPATARTVAPAESPAGGLLAVGETDATVRAALDGLVDRERLALLLRDSYDLPMPSVAVALRRPPDAAAALLATARLHLVEAFTGLPAPSLGEHPGRLAVTPALLAELVDGSLPPPRVATLRRHLPDCASCEQLADHLAHARALMAALPVLGLADEARADLLAAVGERADRVLPTPAQVAAAAARAVDSPLRVSWGLVLLLLLVAAAAGAAVGALL